MKLTGVDLAVCEHGVGRVDEYPVLAHKSADWDNGGYDGVFEENRVLSRYPWQEDWL